MKAQQSSGYTLMLAPVTAATTARTAQLDLSGVDYASIIVTAGIELNTSSTNVALTLAKSDGTNHTTLSTNTLDNTAAASHQYHVAPNGTYRYLRLTVAPDTTTNGPVLATAIAVTKKELSTSSGGTVI
jgi:hypothetical protein